MLKESYFSLIYNNIEDMVFLVDVEADNVFRFLSVNKSYLAVTGYSEEQVVGKRIEEIHQKTHAAFIIQKYQEAMQLQKTVRFKETADFPQGQLVLETKIMPICDDKGCCTHLLGFAHRMDEQLLELEHQQLITIFDGMDEGIYISDPDTYEVLYANGILKDTFGDVIGKKCYQVLQGLETPCFFCTNEYIFDQNESKLYIWEFYNKLSQRWYRCIDRAISWPNGRRVRFEMAVDITGFKQAVNSLIENEEKYRMLFNRANDAIGLFEITEEGLPGRFIEVNDVVCRRLGYSREELLAMTPWDILDKEQFVIKPEGVQKLVEDKHITIETMEVSRNGEKTPIEISVDVFRLNGRKIGLSIVRDITERKRTEKALQETNQLLQQIIESLPDATFVIDRDKKVIAWNRAIEEMTGVSKEEIIGKGNYAYAVPFFGVPRPLLIDLIFSDDKENKSLYQNVERKGNLLCVETPIRSLPGRKASCMWGAASPLFDSEENLIGAIESIRDITERKKMEEQLQYLATHDVLTNIPNRYSLEENLKRTVAKAKQGEKSALFFIDLDNFKLVNDTLGHAAGDELLIALVRVFRTSLREEDFLARLGGDEFAVLKENISEQEAGITAEKLRSAVCGSEWNIYTFGPRLNLSISIGIIMVDGTFDYHRYLSLADTALYAAKEGGRNRFAFAEPEEDPINRLTETNQLLGLIKNALQENRFVLHFQPVVRISDGQIIHHEALIRLRDKNGQIIFPGSFIPLAERFGLMSQIDNWVVQSSLATMREYPELKLFINLSGVTLGDEAILGSIESNIRKSSIEPSRIGFEITETAAVKDISRAELWIRRLKALGCLFALDDFGTGFSSFSYLRMLPVDYIKIDGSFVRNVDTEPVHRALIQAIYTIANTLGKKTIAEFVENEDILKILHTIGIDCGQGYYLGRPASYPKNTKLC